VSSSTQRYLAFWQRRGAYAAPALQVQQQHQGKL
jgi:hypothetical protein